MAGVVLGDRGALLWRRDRHEPAHSAHFVWVDLPLVGFHRENGARLVLGHELELKSRSHGYSASLGSNVNSFAMSAVSISVFRSAWTLSSVTAPPARFAQFAIPTSAPYPRLSMS